jgi:hypothetical protein
MAVFRPLQLRRYRKGKKLNLLNLFLLREAEEPVEPSVNGQP